MTIKSVFFYTNGMTRVFDEKNQIVPGLQGKYEEVYKKLYAMLAEQPTRPGFFDEPVSKVVGTVKQNTPGVVG